MHVCDSTHLKYYGIMKIVFGALLLLNAFVWPKWLGIDGWIAFVAVLVVIAGIVKLTLHKSCCPAEVPVAKPITKKKKRK